MPCDESDQYIICNLQKILFLMINNEDKINQKKIDKNFNEIQTNNDLEIANESIENQEEKILENKDDFQV